jgi:hypothetical protein
MNTYEASNARPAVRPHIIEGTTRRISIRNFREESTNPYFLFYVSYQKRYNLAYEEEAVLYFSKEYEGLYYKFGL